MNLIQVLNKLEKFAKQQKFVSQVTIGDIYENLNGHPDIKYSVINIDIPSVSINENLQVMNIYLYYCDRLTHDEANEYEIKSTSELVLTSIINYLGELGDIYDGYQINFFKQQFADNLAGGYVQIQFETDRILGDCLIDEYEEENEEPIEQTIPTVLVLTVSQFEALEERDPYTVYNVISNSGKLEAVWIGYDCIWVPIID